MKVLIIKTSSMGDILHTLPALTDALQALPKVRFDWVIEENFAQIPTWHPAVHRVIIVAIRRWIKRCLNIFTFRELYNFKQQLQKEHYDAIIDAQGLIKSSLLVTSIAKGEKHGFGYKSAKEFLSGCFYHYRHDISKQKHAIDRIRQLFSAALGYSLPSNPVDYAIADNFIPVNCKEIYLIFIHSATNPKKQWPEIKWRLLIELVAKAGYTIKLPWHQRQEQLRAFRLAKGLKVVQVLPLLSLTEIAIQLSGAKAIVSIDTGLSHLAAALNKPSLTLYGPTNPELIGSYGNFQKILRAKNGKIESLQVEHVWKVLQSILKN